jgi:hypothetical protein
MGHVGEGRLSAGSRFPERRTTPRFAFDARLQITDPIEQTQIVGRVSVLSQKGCFARTQTPLSHRAIVQVEIQKDESVFETWAQATPSHPDMETGVVLVFMDTPPHQAKVLAGWLQDLAAGTSVVATDAARSR